MNYRLRDEQIAAALERHGLSESTEVRGIHYDADRPGPHPLVTITVVVADEARVLVVPDDVLALPATLPIGKRGRVRLWD